jgi:hypothetical protein
LLKFCFNILHAQNLPWKDWLLHHSPFAHHSNNPSFLGALISKHMPTLIMLTQCTVGNGSATFFWHDRWLLSEPLATAFPALFPTTLTNNHLYMRLCSMGLKRVSVIGYLMQRQTSLLSFFLFYRMSLQQIMRMCGFCLGARTSPPKEHIGSCTRTCKTQAYNIFGPLGFQTKLRSLGGCYT